MTLILSGNGGISSVKKRQVLEIWLGADAKLLSDTEVERRFAIKISKAVRELEEDIAQTS
ncbi:MULTISPECIES: hypothetical protein [unclassified Pseudomonas]|uniref:hypothetical protein n=1 Tax=unclassified Pseudomonas TaxID=196821 RepID=UPI0021148679|nr:MULTISPECIES: hypothetical protein [unclassified Pseudomonas]